MIGCPLMCTFCPQPGLKRRYETGNDPREKHSKYMSFENFSRILSKTPKHVRIDFSGMAEPWANPDCTEMLRIALESGYKVAMFSTLYGMSELDADIVVELLRNHSKQIIAVCLHLPDASSNMPGWKYSKNWENVFIKFKELMEENIISSFNIMTMDGSGSAHEDLWHLGLKILPWHGHTRAGSLDESNVAQQNIYTRTPYNITPVSCADTPFYDHNVVLPNGDVLLCCMDYNLKHVIGNLLQQDYYDIFTGAELNRLRQINMTPGFSNCSLCKSCDRTLNYDLSPSVTWSASGDPLVQRDATIAEYRYHLDRINASPWWRFGMAITNLVRGRRAGR